MAGLVRARVRRVVGYSPAFWFPLGWWAALIAALWVVAAVDGLRSRYSFDQQGIYTRRPLRLRAQHIAWGEVQRFENRGAQHGAGAWLKDGRWLKLSGAGPGARRKADKEIALLDFARPHQPATN